MAKKYAELRTKMSPESRARAQAETEEYLLEMALSELRAAQDLTQLRLAKKLKMKQPTLSKIESSVDMYVSTLGKVINGMGGVLEIRAIFPQGAVKINQFSKPGRRRKTVTQKA